jgi:hypothetical protein
MIVWMTNLDPSPWLLLTIPFLAVGLYFFDRGVRRNQFRVPARSGWATYPTGSLNWWAATAVNVVFVGSALFMLFASLFNGSNFSREPSLPMPALDGARVASVIVREQPSVLAQCLANLDHGQVYLVADGGRRVAVRNGRNSLLYTFNIVPDREASRLDVYRLQFTPFVTWMSCTTQQGVERPRLRDGS